MEFKEEQVQGVKSEIEAYRMYAVELHAKESEGGKADQQHKKTSSCWASVVRNRLLMWLNSTSKSSRAKTTTLY